MILHTKIREVSWGASASKRCVKCENIEEGGAPARVRCFSLIDFWASPCLRRILVGVVFLDREAVDVRGRPETEFDFDILDMGTDGFDGYK